MSPQPALGSLSWTPRRAALFVLLSDGMASLLALAKDLMSRHDGETSMMGLNKGKVFLMQTMVTAAELRHLGGWTRWPSKIPFNPNHSVILTENPYSI